MRIRCIVIYWDWDKGPDEQDLRRFCENQPKLFNGRSAPALMQLAAADSVLIASSEPLTDEQARKIGAASFEDDGIRPGDVFEIEI